MELKRAKEVLEKENEQMRGLLLWALYHHQGAHSEVGQPIRRFLGIGQFERMTKEQIATGNGIATWMRDPEGVVKE